MLADVLNRSVNKPQVVETTTRLRDELIKSWIREPSQKERVTPQTLLRSSSLHKICPRAYALSVVSDIPVGTKYKHDTLWAFGTGTAYHDMMQQDALRSLGDIFQGWWYRDADFSEARFLEKFDFGGVNSIGGRGVVLRHERRGEPDNDNIGHGWIKRPSDGHGWQYKEMEGIVRQYRFIGHWDGVLVWPDYTEILELKSVNEWTVDGIRLRPKEDHVLQSNAYMWITGLDRARIVYIDKSQAGLKKAMIEHIVHRDESIIDEIKGLLSDTITAIDSTYEVFSEYQSASSDDATVLRDRVLQSIPDRCEECTKKTDKRPKKCPLKKVCFAKSLLD